MSEAAQPAATRVGNAAVAETVTDVIPAGIVSVVPWTPMMPFVRLVVIIIAGVGVLAVDRGHLTMTDITGREDEAGVSAMTVKNPIQRISTKAGMIEMVAGKELLAQSERGPSHQPHN